MPAPFPGMDPFLEQQEWEDFHAKFLALACDRLSAQLPDGFVARLERRSYFEVEAEIDVFESSPRTRTGRRDVSIVQDWLAQGVLAEAGSLAVEEPLRRRLAELVEFREAYLEIREARTRIVVTALELLSPSNKRAGTEGGRLYAEKRRSVLNSSTNFVELDFLRRGHRLLGVVDDPRSDYYALASRAAERPVVALYAWDLPMPLPTIAVPLTSGYHDLQLELGTMVHTIYEKSHYLSSLDYTAELRPPVPPHQAEWFQHCLSQAIRTM